MACGFSSIKIIFSDYPKCSISRINEVYVFSIKYRNSDILLKKQKLHLSCLFCCNHTCYCVNMVSVTSASCYIMSASRCHPRYQSRSSYIRGLSPRNFAELVKVVPIEENTRHPANSWIYTSRSLFNNCKPIVSQIYLEILVINKVVLQILQHLFQIWTSQ